MLLRALPGAPPTETGQAATACWAAWAAMAAAAADGKLPYCWPAVAAAANEEKSLKQNKDCCWMGSFVPHVDFETLLRLLRGKNRIKEWLEIFFLLIGLERKCSTKKLIDLVLVCFHIFLLQRNYIFCQL
jgi:hypothetical protein